MWPLATGCWGIGRIFRIIFVRGLFGTLRLGGGIAILLVVASGIWFFLRRP